MSKIAKPDITMLDTNGFTADSRQSAPTSPQGAREWATRIGIAQSEEQLVAIANGYLATWLPSDFECLPADCQLSTLSSGEDLALFSVTFVKAELSVAHDSPASAGLIDLVRVFVAGQQRLRQLRSRKFDPSAT